MPFDRVYAIENGSHRFDAQNPKWLPKTNFLQLMRNERLASLTLTFDEENHALALFRDGRQVAKGALKTKLGRQMIEQFLAAYMKAALRGPPRVVAAEGHSFTDIAAKALHIVNLETVRDLSRVPGSISIRCAFAQISISTACPPGRSGIGSAKLVVARCNLKVFDETVRCEATSVDPKTARRGLSVPSVLVRTWDTINLASM